MSTVDIIEEQSSSTFTSPTISFESTPSLNYETLLVSICVLSCIALVISFFKKAVPQKQY